MRTSADPVVNSVPAAMAYAEEDAAKERIGAFWSESESVTIDLSHCKVF